MKGILNQDLVEEIQVLDHSMRLEVAICSGSLCAVIRPCLYALTLHYFSFSLRPDSKRGAET